MPHAVTRADVEAAYALIRPHVRRTPVLTVLPDDLGLDPGLRPVALKLEQLQHAGSFKARGALNTLLSGGIPEAGVVAASGGNHGAALAFAAEKSGVPCNIFVFDHSPQAKVDRIAGFGATVHRGGSDFDTLMAATEAFQQRTGAKMVHAFDAPGTLAGQGTVALEFMADAGLDTLLVATGGGGLIGGIAAYAEDRVKIVSVEPEAAPTLHAAMAAGRIVDAPAGGIAADSLGPLRVGKLMFPIAQSFIDACVLVPDAAIRATWEMLWNRFRIVVEPGGATALAALTSGVYRPEPGERVGVLLCGANTGIVRFDG